MSGSGMHANMSKANEAELCTPLTSIEEREAYYRHKFLADAEKALRPTNPDIAEDIEIVDVELISVQYHLRSNLDLFNQYGTNIDRMPRTKHTSYQLEVGESSRPSVDEEMVDPEPEVSDIREEDIRSVEDSLERQESGGESIGNEDDAGGSEEGEQGEGEEEENDETDEEIVTDFNLAAQIAEEERLDEEYDSDQDDPKNLEPQEIPSDYEITEAVVDPVWLQTATEKDYCQHGKRFYRLPDGYELRLPNNSQTALDCPPGHIVVYAKHLEFGLRFPLHHYIEKIFRAWNVAIAQLTPPTIRNIVSLVWVMIFMDFPLTLNLFRRLHWIKRDSQSPGWWSLFTAPGKCTVWPKLTSCKNWKNEFYFMSVPDDFTVRRTFHHPHSMFETIRSRKLGPMEKKAFKWFNCTYVRAGKKNKAVPGVWLPHCNYILGNAPLSHVGLCHTDAFGLDKLDFSRLGLHSDRRVKHQCPDWPKKSYDTLPSFTTRASTKKRKRRQDMAPTERTTKPRTLAESWPDGVVNLEDETEPQPAKKLTVTLRDPKSLGVSTEVRTGQMASIEKPPSRETTIISGRTGGLNHNAFVPAGVTDFIEIPHVRIPTEVIDGLAVPSGAAGDPSHPRINVNRGESVLCDDPATGESMGWRVLKDLATPSDRPVNRAAAPCGQLMNNMLRTVNSDVEVVHMYHHYQRVADNAETKLKKADDACKLVVKERDKVKSDIKTLQKQVSELNRKLADQELLQKKVASLEQSRKDERDAKAKLASQVEEMERDKPGIRRRAVNRFLQTDLYANLLVDRYTAGWVSAHRCVCKAEGWDSTKWQAVEKAFNEERNHSPTSYESEYFDELPLHAVITNLDPRELPEAEFDDALISSPIATYAGKDGSAGPSSKEVEKEPVNAGESTKEADKN
uniref:Transposase (putative) gypsy type domain-containing protein n=1 Tax=Chenopodium quinoa TaxID=63459 RepID=A0A803LL84_CHEQI